MMTMQSVLEIVRLATEHGVDLVLDAGWGVDALLGRENAPACLDVHVWPGIPYPPESLEGTGTIAGQAVRCITAEWAINFHCQYEPDEDDYRDVSALCEHFGIALPELYRRFVEP